MTKGLINDPAHWCERAAEGRRTADQMTDPMCLQLSTITAASLRGHSDSSYQSRARYCGPRARILCGKATIVAEGRISLVERGQVTVALWSPDRPHRAASGRGAAGVLDRGPPTGGRIEGWKSGCS